MASAELLEYYERIEKEVKDEIMGEDPVLSRVGYTRFLSRSKGRGRKRRCPVVVELIKYLSTYRIPARARLDEIAQELGGVLSDDELLEYLRENGGV